MFDVSWGEITVVVGLGLVLIGRKDLPRAARVAGTQVGRVVGFLQGARAKADRYAAHNELRQLQNELRSGLRELDAVKSELAVSMSGGGFVGRGLGATVAAVNKQMSDTVARPSTTKLTSQSHAPPALSLGQINNPVETSTSFSNSSQGEMIGAVAEEEWEKQGIGFRSRAEQGAGLSNFDPSTSGSALLSNLMKQTLIFDQYDKVVRQQDEALQSKIENIQEQIKKGGKDGKDA
jgi:Sec-independent protein translocase protein TatA